MIRDLLWRRHDSLLSEANVIGGWWNRNHSLEVDLVGADRVPNTRRVGLVGSIKWREQHKFDLADASALVEARKAIPGAMNAKLVAISRAGFDNLGSEIITYTPEQLFAQV